MGAKQAEQLRLFGSELGSLVADGKHLFLRIECKLTDTVEPEPELAAKYEERYQKFRKIYPACRDLFLELAK